MTPVRTSGVITLFAVGFLALDGVLLALAGIWAQKPGLVAWGAVFGIGALAVVFSWRRYQRQIRELHQAIATREMELLAMQREIEQHRPK